MHTTTISTTPLGIHTVPTSAHPRGEHLQAAPHATSRAQRRPSIRPLSRSRACHAGSRASQQPIARATKRPQPATSPPHHSPDRSPPLPPKRRPPPRQKPRRHLLATRLSRRRVCAIRKAHDKVTVLILFPRRAITIRANGALRHEREAREDRWVPLHNVLLETARVSSANPHERGLL
jgi:hypothetical protein